MKKNSIAEEIYDLFYERIDGEVMNDEGYISAEKEFDSRQEIYTEGFDAGQMKEYEALKAALYDMSYESSRVFFVQGMNMGIRLVSEAAVSSYELLELDE